MHECLGRRKQVSASFLSPQSWGQDSVVTSRYASALQYRWGCFKLQTCCCYILSSCLIKRRHRWDQNFIISKTTKELSSDEVQTPNQDSCWSLRVSVRSPASNAVLHVRLSRQVRGLILHSWPVSAFQAVVLHTGCTSESLVEHLKILMSRPHPWPVKPVSLRMGSRNEYIL